MILTHKDSSFYNFQARDIYSTGVLYCEFDIKFTDVYKRQSRSTSHNTENIQNGGQTVNNAGGQSSSVVNTQKNSMTGGVNNLSLIHI